MECGTKHKYLAALEVRLLQTGHDTSIVTIVDNCSNRQPVLVEGVILHYSGCHLYYPSVGSPKIKYENPSKVLIRRV